MQRELPLSIVEKVFDPELKSWPAAIRCGVVYTVTGIPDRHRFNGFHGAVKRWCLADVSVRHIDDVTTFCFYGEKPVRKDRRAV